MFFQSLCLTKKSINEPALLSTQFKVIHNITNCNANLFKWKIKDSDKCTLCSENECDTIMHSLVNCNHSKNIIQTTLQSLAQYSTIPFDINPMEFIFGSHDRALNMIYLILKKHIIRIRASNQQINKNIILNDIYRRIIIEKRKNAPPYKFESKWSEYDQLVQHAELVVLH